MLVLTLMTRLCSVSTVVADSIAVFATMARKRPTFLANPFVESMRKVIQVAGWLSTLARSMTKKRMPLVYGVTRPFITQLIKDTLRWFASCMRQELGNMNVVKMAVFRCVWQCVLDMLRWCGYSLKLELTRTQVMYLVGVQCMRQWVLETLRWCACFVRHELRLREVVQDAKPLWVLQCFSDIVRSRDCSLMQVLRRTHLIAASCSGGK
mmetsp:Transcript_112602/g.357863  ORF Transcript_112602/g.357863 Transcript_112602/m.357863 type:complete len:209 (+) Transcript_112602:236-862(+)